MVKVVEKNVEAIKELCERMQIQSLYLFGSGISEKNFTSESDLDFLFQFKKDEQGLSICFGAKASPCLLSSCVLSRVNSNISI